MDRQRARSTEQAYMGEERLIAISSPHASGGYTLNISRVEVLIAV